MKENGYYRQNNLYYSDIFGRGVYEWHGEFVQDPLCGDRGAGQKSPLLTNTFTGEQFFLRRFACSQKQMDCYKAKVLLPPGNTHILWPSDVVTLTEEQKGSCSLFVAQEYSPAPMPDAQRTETYALVFPYSGYPRVINGFQKLSQLRVPNWKQKEVQRMAIEIARALESLNESGYFYADIHLSRLYFEDEGTAYLDFSNLIFAIEDTVGREAGELCQVGSTEYPIEFGDPAVVRKLSPFVDYHSQNFSLCALFFYLFFGRCAYDGQLLTGYADSTPQNHYIKFTDYHKMPIFIFDPEDGQNALGEFFEEQKVIELWNELPEQLKELFTRTLRRENAERSAAVNNPTPSAWLRCFEEIGWEVPAGCEEGDVTE